MPNVDAGSKFFGGERGQQFVPLGGVALQSHKLVDLQTSRCVQQFQQLHEVVVLELNSILSFERIDGVQASCLDLEGEAKRLGSVRSR